MELLLIRHALPLRRELEHGIADPPLTPDGRAQAEHMACYLATEQLHAVYSSPLRRAQETAAVLGAATGLDVVVDDDVAEWDRDSNEYIPAEELKASGDPRWAVLAGGGFTHDDESIDHFRDRVVPALERLVDAHPGERIAVVCHGGVINMYLSHVLGLPPSAGFFYPNYTSIHRVAASRRGHRTIVTVNETSHLRGTGLPMGVVQQG